MRVDDEVELTQIVVIEKIDEVDDDEQHKCLIITVEIDEIELYFNEISDEAEFVEFDMLDDDEVEELDDLDVIQNMFIQIQILDVDIDEIE